MAYYLTVKDKNNYKLLNVSMLNEFNRKSNFKNNSYSLEEIDGFTSMFRDEYDLKRELYEMGVISLDDITKEITIRRKHKDEYIKVMYDMVYQYNSKYLDVMYLRHIFLHLQKDKVFINKLLNHYRNNYNQEHLRKIRAGLEGYYDDISMSEAMSSFFIDEIYDVDYKTGNTRIKYKAFHDLAMFVYNYVSKKDKTQYILNAEVEQRIKKLEELKEGLVQKTEKVTYKTRVKKKYDLDGQTSFF